MDIYEYKQLKLLRSCVNVDSIEPNIVYQLFEYEYEYSIQYATYIQQTIYVKALVGAVHLFLINNVYMHIIIMTAFGRTGSQ